MAKNIINAISGTSKKTFQIGLKNFVKFDASDITDNYTLNLPARSGTIALTSDIYSGFSTTYYDVSSNNSVVGINEICLIDTTSGSFSLYLPLTPEVGNIIRFVDLYKNFDVNNFTLLRNGNKIDNELND